MEATIQTLHGAQLSMDNDIKMLMLKMWIQTGRQPKNTAKNKDSTRAATESEANESITWISVDDINTQIEDEEMDGTEEFTELIDEVFDNVLQQCKRERTHIISPQKVYKTSNLSSLRPI